MAEKPVKIVSARWIASYEAQMVNGTVLVPGETVVQIPEPEALASDNWEIVSGGKSGGPGVKEMRAEAKAKGITIPTGSKKPDIERLLAEHDAAEASEEQAEEQTEPPTEEPVEPESTEGDES